MAILVTGATGYIGSHTIIELIKNGYEIVGFDNFSNSSSEVLKRIKMISNQSICFYEGSVEDKLLLNRIFMENSINAVIHFAAYKAVAESVEDPLKYYQNNLNGFLTICEVMKENNVKTFIFSSSATVYGNHNCVPYTEEMSIDADNPYGLTKVMIERMLEDIASSDDTWRIVSLRYFNPVGAHPSGIMGEDPKGVPDNLMPYITQVASGERSFLFIFGNDYKTVDGTGVRDYIHVMDLAEGHIKALEYALNHKGYQVFNLGSGKGYSVLQVVEAFEKTNNVKIPYKLLNRRQGDIALSYADTVKAKRLLDWEATKTIEDMCRDAWTWQRKNPNGYEGE